MTFLSNLHQLFNGVDFEELIQEIDSVSYTHLTLPTT